MNFRSYYFYSLFFTCILFSQNEYKFDTFSKISNTNSSRENESTYLINSSDDSYFMEIYSHSDSTFSRIYDSGNLVSHYFYLDKSDSLKLNFIKTFKFKKYDKFKKKETENDHLLDAFSNYMLSREKITECEDTECDMIFITEHESYRRSYLYYLDKYRRLKNEFFSKVQGQLTLLNGIS